MAPLMMIPRKRAVMMPVMLYRMIMATAVVGEESGTLPVGMVEDVGAEEGLLVAVDPFGKMLDMLAFGLAAKRC